MTPAEEKALIRRIEMIEKRQARIYAELGLRDRDLEQLQMEDAVSLAVDHGDFEAVMKWCCEADAGTRRQRGEGEKGRKYEQADQIPSRSCA